MSTLFTIILRAGIGAALFFGVFGQIIVVPTQMADNAPYWFAGAMTAEIYTAVGILGIACIQAVMVAVWMLLAMVERDAIFTPRAFRWIDLIIAASIAATLLALGVAVHLTVASAPAQVDDMNLVSMWLFAIACVGVGACFAMLMVVMRGLLRKATNLETEMAEVV
jgi:hypothetical protein